MYQGGVYTPPLGVLYSEYSDRHSVHSEQHVVLPQQNVGGRVQNACSIVEELSRRRVEGVPEYLIVYAE